MTVHLKIKTIMSLNISILQIPGAFEQALYIADAGLYVATLSMRIAPTVAKLKQ